MKVTIKKIKTKYWDTSIKFGIKIPKNIKEAERFDVENENTFWMDTVKEEMQQIRKKAVEEHNGSIEELEEAGFQEIRGHLIFDVKLSENFLWKGKVCC